MSAIGLVDDRLESRAAQDAADSPAPAAPTVSLGLPVYNGERYLEETIESILRQSYTDFELIISDNASTDRTEEICRRFVRRDGRVRYRRNERNIGAAPNYNLTFQLARGRYFKWVAHDDLYEPTFLERCVAALDSDPEVVLAYAAAVDIDEHGRFLGNVDFDLHVDAPHAHERFRYLVCINHSCLPIFGVIRADVLRKTPLMGSYVASDRVLLAELALHGRFHEIPERLFLHREHPQRSTRAIPDLRARAVWFDTRLVRGQRLPTLRVFAEYVSAIRRAPLELDQSARCWIHLLRWWKHNWRTVVSELRGSHAGS
ncbi:MAG TPA: glycosyltransferase family 2 protein [Longimicrobiales bacterium]